MVGHRRMSEGVEKAAAIIPFCTEKYQTSQNCKTELSLAYDNSIPILPVICDDNYTKKQAFGEEKVASKWPCGWLAASIAGKIYVDFRSCRDFESSFKTLVENIENETEFSWKSSDLDEENEIIKPVARRNISTIASPENQFNLTSNSIRKKLQEDTVEEQEEDTINQLSLEEFEKAINEF